MQMNRNIHNSDEYFLPFTLKILMQQITNLQTMLQNEDERICSPADNTKDIDYTSKLRWNKINHQMNTILQTDLKYLDWGSEEMGLLRLAIIYRNVVESALVKTRLRLSRLEEEYVWLNSEMAYFESQKLENDKLMKDTMSKIDHYYFLYKGRQKYKEDFDLPVFSGSIQNVLSSDEHQKGTTSILIGPTSIHLTCSPDDGKDSSASNGNNHHHKKSNGGRKKMMREYSIAELIYAFTKCSGTKLSLSDLNLLVFKHNTHSVQTLQIQ
ncbi:unnamed protein product [Trichobilharzia szidati]|nr:unnamed protein product [Trichobilharzia szidati]